MARRGCQHQNALDCQTVKVTAKVEAATQSNARTHLSRGVETKTQTPLFDSKVFTLMMFRIVNRMFILSLMPVFIFWG